MKLPNHDRAVIPESKIRDYLLSLSHRDGRSKAEFFNQFGFTVDAWEQLAQVLRQHAKENNVAKTEDSPFGTRYVIEGKILTPDGRTPLIRSIWFIPSDGEVPWFVTAYPLKRRTL